QPVSIRERARTILRHVAMQLEAAQRFERIAGADSRVASAIDQGKRVHHEFQLADAAAAQLHVPLDHRGVFELSLYLLLHRAELAQSIEVEEAPIYEIGQVGDHPLPVLDRSRYRTCTEQRRALPRLPEGFIKTNGRIKTDHQRGRTTARPEPQI